jgi:hypothetical protein
MDETLQLIDKVILQEVLPSHFMHRQLKTWLELLTTKSN